MFSLKEKVDVFRFYESWLENFYDSSQDCLGYLRLGVLGNGLQINEDGKFSAINNIKQIQLKRLIPCSVPQSVIDSFERHYYYSQYNLSDISVLKLKVSDKNTFAVCICGYVCDWWDNSGLLLEVYDIRGNFIISMGTSLPWEDRILDHKDYNYPLTPPYNQPGGYRQAWSEEDILDV
jgi:hypothetical protein